MITILLPNARNQQTSRSRVLPAGVTALPTNSLMRSTPTSRILRTSRKSHEPNDNPMKRRVVVCDDHAGILATIVGVLTPDFEVAAAVRSGQQALDACAEF